MDDPDAVQLFLKVYTGRANDFYLNLKKDAMSHVWIADCSIALIDRKVKTFGKYVTNLTFCWRVCGFYLMIQVSPITGRIQNVYG
jgi:hypothetical protein